jgi:hypothetical protein
LQSFPPLPISLVRDDLDILLSLENAAELFLEMGIGPHDHDSHHPGTFFG